MNIVDSEKPRQFDQLGLLTELAVRLIRDAAYTCVISKEDVVRDISYVYQRAQAEGISFFTKALPCFGASLNTALTSGQPLVPPPFAKVRAYREHSIPVFLSGYYEIIADALDGNTGPMATWTGQVIAAVRSVRQITMFAYKLQVPLSPEAEEKALKASLELDRSLPMSCLVLDVNSVSAATRRALANATLLLGVLLADNPSADEVLVPKHGPGALATGERNWEKGRFKRWYPALDAQFPYSDYLYLNYSHLAEHLHHLHSMEFAIPISKATCVPKDSRGPRVINMEPLELMWVQQALKGYLYNHVERHWLTCGHVNFTSQDVNRQVCLKASTSFEYDTLDMKDASDRVSLQLVRKLLPEHWFDMLESCRSIACDYGKLGTWGLRKFAPMGSACCFPVESMIFWALAVGSLKDIVTSGDLRRLPDVYVFGDDIIVPSGAMSVLEPVFNELHLKFNKDKCCTSGTVPFRESCGMDALNGVPIAPIRLKELWPGNDEKPSPQACLAYCEYANGLTQNGWFSAGAFLRRAIRDSQFSYVVHTTANRQLIYPLGLYEPGLSWSGVIASNAHLRLRWSTKLQRHELRAWRTPPVTIEVKMSGWDLLQTKLTKPELPGGNIWRKLSPRVGVCQTYDVDPSPDPLWGRTRNRRRVAIPNAIKFGTVWLPVDELLSPSYPITVRGASSQVATLDTIRLDLDDPQGEEPLTAQIPAAEMNQPHR